MSKPTDGSKIEVPDEVLKELLTPSEMRMLKNRYQVIKLLSKGLSIRAVAQRAKVGTDTVVRISRMVDKEELEILTKKEETPNKSTYVFGKSRA